MKKLINWFKNLFSPKKLVSEKIVKKTLKHRGSGVSKSTFSKSGVSKSTFQNTKKRKPRKTIKK